MISHVSVGPAPHGYEVLIGARLIDCAGDRLAPSAPRGRIGVIADRGVADHHGERLAAALESGGLSVDFAVAPKGEAFWRPDFDLGRIDLLAAFGGVGVQRLANELAPALAPRRGLVRIPTTLAAQAGCVLAPGPEPLVVLADLDVLATLGPAQVRAGCAEAMRLALAADAQLFSWLEARIGEIQALRAPELGHLVGGCVRLAAARGSEPGVAGFGRDLALALVAQSPTPPGDAEAEALGAALAFRISAALGLCDIDHAERATWNIAALGLPARIEDAPGGPWSAARLVAALSADGAVRLALTRGLGAAFLAEDVNDADLAEILIAEGVLP